MAAYDILTSTEVKAYLGISGSDKDTLIGTFISDVSLWIEEFTGRKIASQTVTGEIGNGSGTEYHVPKYVPVTAVTTLQDRETPDDSWADIVSDSDHILVDQVNGDYIELYGDIFPAGSSNIKLTYTAGYSTVPNTIKQVAYEMVAIRLRESNDPALGQNRLGMASNSSSQSGVNYSKSYIDLMPKWEKILRPYRTKRVIGRSFSQTEMMR